MLDKKKILHRLKLLNAEPIRWKINDETDIQNWRKRDKMNMEKDPQEYTMKPVARFDA